MDKNTDIGAINSKEQMDKIAALVKQGEKEGGQVWQPACEIPRNGFWFKPTLIMDVSPTNTVAREEIFGPVLSVMTFRTPAEAVAKANNTEYGLECRHLDREGFENPEACRSAKRWRGLGKHFQPVRCHQPIWWVQGIWLWQGGRPSRARRLPEGRFLMRLEIKKTYKLFIGGKFPRTESGRSYEVVDSKGNHLANAAKASRKDVRDSVVAARAAQAGWASASAYNRGQILYRIAEMLEGRKEQFIE